MDVLSRYARLGLRRVHRLRSREPARAERPERERRVDDRGSTMRAPCPRTPSGKHPRQSIRASCERPRISSTVCSDGLVRAVEPAARSAGSRDAMRRRAGQWCATRRRSRSSPARPRGPRRPWRWASAPRGIRGRASSRPTTSCTAVPMITSCNTTTKPSTRVAIGDQPSQLVAKRKLAERVSRDRRVHVVPTRHDHPPEHVAAHVHSTRKPSCQQVRDGRLPGRGDAGHDDDRTSRDRIEHTAVSQLGDVASTSHSCRTGLNRAACGQILLNPGLAHEKEAPMFAAIAIPLLMAASVVVACKIENYPNPRV